MGVNTRIVQRFLKVSRSIQRVNYKDLDEYFEDMDALAYFARAVMTVAKSPKVRKFHDDRAFIGSIKEIGFPRSDRFSFDCKLVAAHVKGLLSLTRADLVAAMDRKDLDDSEVEYQNSTFNFVRL